MANSRSIKSTAIPGVNITLEELLRLQNTPLVTMKPAKVLALQSGQHLSRLRGRGMDFSEVRRYQSGDDIRHMEWRVTARTGNPHVKLYHEERERPVFLVVDFNPSMFFGTKVAFKSVIAARFAAMLGFSASHHGDRVGGVVYSGSEIKEIKPRARKQGVLPLLNTLSEFSFLHHQKDAATPMSEVLLQLRRVAKPGSLVFFLSDFNHFDTQAQAALSRLQRHTDIVAYLLSDCLEKTPPRAGHYPVTDGINEAIINTKDDGFCKHYSLVYQHKIEKIKPLFKPGQFIELGTDSDLQALLANAFVLTRLGVSR